MAFFTRTKQKAFCRAGDHLLSRQKAVTLALQTTSFYFVTKESSETVSDVSSDGSDEWSSAA